MGTQTAAVAETANDLQPLCKSFAENYSLHSSRYTAVGTGSILHLVQPGNVRLGFVLDSGQLLAEGLRLRQNEIATWRGGGGERRVECLHRVSSGGFIAPTHREHHPKAGGRNGWMFKSLRVPVTTLEQHS